MIYRKNIRAYKIIKEIEERMKYLKVFVSIIYFIVLSVITLWVLMRNISENFSDTLSYRNDPFSIFGGYIDPLYFISFILGLLIILIFIIYLPQIKNNLVFLSALFLALSFNVFNFIIFNILISFSRGDQYSSIIISNALLLIIPIGLLVLSIYFKDKYKKSLK